MSQTLLSQPTIERAREVLAASFGYSDFRAGQTVAVESVLAGRDTLVILPTGGGKSLCFQVPAIILPKLTVVISPLISLMKDQVDTLNRKGVPAAFINSTLSQAQVSERMSRAAKGEIKLLYVAPERFDAGNTARHLRDIGVSLLAIDEAHCISQWGHDFRPSYLRVRDVRAELGDPPTIALTATATPSVRQDISEQLGLRDPKVIITGFDRTNLSYSVLPAKNDNEKDARLVNLLKEYDGLAVVYASTRKSVERIASVLKRNRISSAAYHAGLDDDHRQEVQEAFMTEKVRAIVATNAFGMGIDKPNVRLVLHHSMPGTLEAYYQEAGRAGRDGLHSDVFLLHAFPDRFTHEFFIKGSYPEQELVESVYTYLQRACSPSGFVAQSLDQIALGIKSSKVTPRDVESAIRVLEQGGVVKKELDSYTKVHVRLLATPQRITSEVGSTNNPELAVLRQLWRSHGQRLYNGAQLDLSTLPSSLGTPRDLMEILEALQSRQIVVVERLGGGFLLSDRTMQVINIPVDWRTLSRRRRNELSKLEAIQGYAYTKECRRTFVLRYFGDRTARSGNCGACDNCRGIVHAPVVVEGASAGRGGAGKKRGVSSSSIADDRAVKLSGESGAFNRSSKGAFSGSSEMSSGTASRKKPDSNAVLENPADQALLESLKILRSEIAREQKVPAYIVFDNKTLHQMAVLRPRTESSLLALRGVGPTKVEKYGQAFLEAIAKHS